MDTDERECAVALLVKSRYPSEVKRTLQTVLDHPDRNDDDLHVIVGAALSRTYRLGHEHGVSTEKDRLWKKLGL